MEIKSLLFTLLVGTSLSASVVYDNTTTDLNLSYIFSTNGATQFGDVVTLGGTDRFLTSATVQFFNAAATAGTFDTTLRLWQVGSPVGAQIGPNFTLTGLNITGFDINTPGSGILTVTFTGLNVLVPNSLAFSLSVANPTGGVDMGVNIFGPTPGTGTSDPDSLLWDIGNGLATASVAAGEGNLYLQLNAVPEPSSILLFSGAALVGLLRLRRR